MKRLLKILILFNVTLFIIFNINLEKRKNLIIKYLLFELLLEKLDLKDRRILHQLEKNSRQSLQKIARAVGLKKETVYHRIRKLEESGIIKSYTTEIDVYSLGYRFYPMLIKFQNTTKVIEDEIYEYLKKNQNIAWLTKCDGSWDINLTIVAYSVIDVEKFVEKLLSKYGQYIANKHVFITTEIYYCKRGFIPDHSKVIKLSSSESVVFDISKEDREILSILTNNARTPIIDIGRLLKTNPKNISNHIKRLEKEKIIQGYGVLVDFKKLGFKFYKVWFSLKSLDNKKLKEMMLFFQMMPNIVWITKIIGYYDLSIEIKVEEGENYHLIIDQIKEKFSEFIRSYESLLIFEETLLKYLP